MNAAAQPVETIGRCEWCGLVDHHLVADECPACRGRAVEYPPLAPSAEDIRAPAVGAGLARVWRKVDGRWVEQWQAWVLP